MLFLVLQSYFEGMFIRKNKNRNKSVSIQIIAKANRKYKVVKSFGSGKTNEEIEKLYQKARQYLHHFQRLFGT